MPTISSRAVSAVPPIPTSPSRIRSPVAPSKRIESGVYSMFQLVTSTRLPSGLVEMRTGSPPSVCIVGSIRRPVAGSTVQISPPGWPTYIRSPRAFIQTLSTLSRGVDHPESVSPVRMSR